MRTTHKQIMGTFDRLCKMKGKSTELLKTGAWQVDCYKPGNQKLYIIEETCNKDGGVFHPYGDYRRTSGEFWRFLRSLISYEINKGGRE